MAQRSHPVAQVQLYGAGEHRAKYDGFGHYEVAGELVAGGQVGVSAVDPAELGLWTGWPYRAAVPSAAHVSAGGLNTVLCRPFVDTSQGLGLGHFAPLGGRWRALRGLGLGAEVKLYQEDGRSNRFSGLESRFSWPHNPMFALSLWRAEPGLDHDWQRPPYTEIHFGISEREEWAIVIPYGMPLFLMRRQGGEWSKVSASEGALRLPTMEGLAKGQRVWLWFGVLRGKPVLSTDGFGEEVWVFETGPQPVSVASSPMTMWHNAGQWMVSVLPIKMTMATLSSRPVDSGYLTEESSGAPFLEGKTLPVTDGQGRVLAAVLGNDDTAEREGLSPSERSYRVQIIPYRHRQEGVGIDPETQQSVDFETWVSPEWIGNQIGQYAEVESQAAGEGIDLSGAVLRVTGSRSLDRPTARYTVELDNQLGQQAGIKEHSRVDVELGWKTTEGVETRVGVFSGHVVEPPREREGSEAARLRLKLLDPMIRLQDEKADGRAPVFDGWPVVEVMRWVLGRCGIPESQQVLEDTGLCLSAGEVEEPIWRVEMGRSWGEFLREVARFDYNAALYWDETGVFHKGCRHCLQARSAEDMISHDGGLEGACSSEVAWQLYTRGAAASDPTAAGEILGLQRHRQSLHSDHFANYVVVCGVGPDGRPLRAVTYEPDSLLNPESEVFVGWRKMDVWRLRGYVSEEAVNRLAAERLRELSARPEHILVVTPLLPEAKLGEIMQINGGETEGADGQLYRVTGVSHEVERRPHQVAVTTLQGRWIGEG
jgi:hypothetical protein